MKVIVVYSFMDDELKSLANRMCMYLKAKYDINVDIKSVERLSDDLFSLRKVSLDAIRDTYKSTYFLGICKNGDSTESGLASILKSASLKGRSTYIHDVEKLSYFKRGSKALDTLHMIIDFFIENDISENTKIKCSEEPTETDFDVCFEALYLGDFFIDLVGKEFMEDIPDDFIIIDDVTDEIPCKYALTAKIKNFSYPDSAIYFEMVSISNDNGCWLSLSDSPHTMDGRDVVNDYLNIAMLTFAYVPFVKGQFCDSIFNSKNTVKFKVNGKEFEQELVISKD